MTRTVDDVIRNLPRVRCPKPRTPTYNGSSSSGVGLAVECMSRHMSNEGWEVMLGLRHGGYPIYGFNIPETGELTDCNRILKHSDPGVVVVQDQREWDVHPGNFREHRARFTNIESLNRSDLFTLTVLRDAHHNPPYHSEFASVVDVKAWVCFYHPRVVHHLAPYTRPEHLVRSYNSVNVDDIPEFNKHYDRRGCLLSGAVSAKVYPLRSQLLRDHKRLPKVDVLKHPGYHARGTHTPRFLKELNGYKVAICTSSIYGYALRKLIEATACGCIVLTDLPVDEVLPEIDDNLVRIDSHQTTKSMSDILRYCYVHYNEDRQRYFAEKAKKFYDYRAIGARLVSDIERLRCEYSLQAV